MAQKEITSIRIKAMVDTEKNRVVFVESDQDFIDVLLSFLTLPLGTITRLIKDVNTESSSTPAAIGCMHNLYKSVENLDVKYFSTDHCKIMLLYPRRAAEEKCNNLKLKIDHSEPTEYYSTYSCENTSYLHKVCVTRSGVLPCWNCSKCSDRSKLIYLGVYFPIIPISTGGRVFVKGGINARYIVTDNLLVKSGSVGACISMIGVHEIHDWSTLEERNVDVSRKDVLSLLQRSLISKTPLTDLILLNGGELKMESRVNCTLYSKGLESQETTSNTSAKLCVTLVISKSTNKSLYAVVKDDFVNLLFSFLTLPLGSIVKLCGGTSSMGCVDNLYKSVEDLSSQGEIISEDCKAILVNPKLATHFRSMNQLLWVDEVENKYKKFTSLHILEFLRNVGGAASSDIDIRKIRKMINPKLPGFSETKSGGQFLASRATYMVTNDLVVTPLCLTTGIVFLKSKNVPISDVEERIVTIDKQEAFNLLMASLFLDNALDAIMGSTDKVANPTGPTVKKEQLNKSTECNNRRKSNRSKRIRLETD